MASSIATRWREEAHWDPPREGAREFLQALRDAGFDVVVFTTRWAPDVRRWLETHSCSRPR